MLFSEQFDLETRASRAALVRGLTGEAAIDCLRLRNGLSALQTAGRRLDNIGASRALDDYAATARGNGESALRATFRSIATEHHDLLTPMLDASLDQLATGPSPAHAFGAFFAIEHVNLTLAGSQPSQALSDFLDRFDAAIRQGEVMIAVGHAVLDKLTACLNMLPRQTSAIRSAPCAA